MLVLSRRRNEKIMIGDNIEITIVDISPDGKCVRLGFKAPREVSVHRMEIWELVKKEQKKKE